MPQSETSEEEYLRDPLRRACCIILRQMPLLLPLITIAGTLCGGTVGWGTVVVTVVLAHALRQWRIMLCSLLCGAFVWLTQDMRQEQAETLQRTVEAEGAVSLRGVVVRELSHGCIVEMSGVGTRVALRGEVPWRVADIVRVTAEARPVTPPPVEGMFSQEKWLQEQGIGANLTYLYGEKEGESWGMSRWARLGGMMRDALSGILMPAGMEEDPRAQTLCALVLGDKERAEAGTMETFRRGGCLHVFAVSGLHVGLVAALLWGLLRLLRVPLRVGRWVVLIVVGGYVLATGLAAPALRAYLMLAAWLIGLMLGRRVSVGNTWCFAALLLLMLRPWQIYQAGFLLSFGVYAAICIGVKYCKNDSPWFGPDAYIPARLRTRGEYLLSRVELAVRGVVVVSICAWLASLPICISRFHVVNTASYLTNIVVSPLLPVVMCAGLLALLLSPLPLVGALCHSLALHAAGWLIRLVGIGASCPGAFLPACPPASPNAAMVVCLSYGKSYGVLGNPGVLVGDLRQEGDARYNIEPALFHAGYTPAALGSDAGKALPVYRTTFPRIMVPETRGVAVQRLRTEAGQFTFYYPPAELPRATESHGRPIILWERTRGDRVLYIGDAPMETLETMPPEARRADIVIIGYNPKDPVMDTDDLRDMGAGLFILLPSAARWKLTEQSVFPASIIRLSPDERPTWVMDESRK